VWIFDQINRIESMLTQVLRQNAQIMSLISKGQVNVMALQDDVDDLVAAVEQRKTVGDSVMALLTELHTMLTDALASAGPSVDPAVEQKLTEAIDALKAKNAEVAAAITANTPQASVEARTR
jgi:hypothetical protein